MTLGEANQVYLEKTMLNSPSPGLYPEQAITNIDPFLREANQEHLGNDDYKYLNKLTYPS